MKYEKGDLIHYIRNDKMENKDYICIILNREMREECGQIFYLYKVFSVNESRKDEYLASFIEDEKAWELVV